MKSQSSSLRIMGGLLAAVACFGSLQAQTLTFNPVTQTPTNFDGAAGDYEAFIGGVSTPTTLDYPGYNATVSAGTGSGALLIGQSFLAVCVNVSYPAFAQDVEYNFSTDGSTLSYDIDADAPGGDGPAGDSWAIDRTAKYDAIRDIVATFGATLVSMDQGSADFQQRMTALNMAFAEIVVDGVPADADSLTTGNMGFGDGGGAALSGPVATYYQEYLDAAGNGSGADYTLYAAGVSGFGSQDVILIPVPEPTAAALIGAAGLLGLIRRRRLA